MYGYDYLTVEEEKLLLMGCAVKVSPYTREVLGEQAADLLPVTPKAKKEDVQDEERRALATR